MIRFRGFGITIFVQALIVCSLLFPATAFAELEIGTAIAKHRAAADEAFEKGKFAEGAKDLQWIANQNADVYGLAEARAELGYMYEIGRGVERNMEKAESLYRKAAEEQTSSNAAIEASERLLLLYDYDSANFPEWRRVFQLTRKRAKAEIHMHEYALAYIYLYGFGVKKDEVTAAQWMKRATAGYNPHALYLLGVMTARGIGVQENATEAKVLFKRAAELGSQEAIAALQSARPLLPEPYRVKTSVKAACSDMGVVRQVGFPKPGQAEDFENFRQRLRNDLVEMMTKQADSGKSATTGFADSIDDGMKGKSLVAEITGMAGGPRFVPPMWGLLQSILTTACPVGYGGHFTDNLKRDLELWYVTFDSENNHEELTVFKNPLLPAYGEIKRQSYPTFVFSRDNKGRLMWYALSSEMASLLNHWFNIQLQ